MWQWQEAEGAFPATSPEKTLSWHLFRLANGGFPAETAGTGGGKSRVPNFPFETLPSPVIDDIKEVEVLDDIGGERVKQSLEF